MIDRTHALPVARQCQLLQLARSTAYYQPRPVSETALTLMRRIDELHLQYPFAGARMLRDLLRQEGHAIGRRQVVTLMRRMGITAIYRKPRTSQRHPAHRTYPYLLRQMTITRPNHVWASDITYGAPRPGMLGEAYAWNAKRKEDLRSCLVPCCEGA
jgi:putative transposase